MPKHSFHILELARKGAEHRLRELKAEIASLKKVFPHLRFGSGVSPAMPDPMEEGKVRRPRRRMSAAARKKISEAQKRRWAKQKAAK
jgi:hypothetical protein